MSTLPGRPTVNRSRSRGHPGRFRFCFPSACRRSNRDGNAGPDSGRSGFRRCHGFLRKVRRHQRDHLQAALGVSRLELERYHCDGQRHDHDLRSGHAIRCGDCQPGARGEARESGGGVATDQVDRKFRCFVGG